MGPQTWCLNILKPVRTIPIIIACNPFSMPSLALIPPYLIIREGIFYRDIKGSHSIILFHTKVNILIKMLVHVLRNDILCFILIANFFSWHMVYCLSNSIFDWLITWHDSQELHNHSKNVSDWFKNWYLICFDQSAGCSQGLPDKSQSSLSNPHLTFPFCCHLQTYFFDMLKLQK